MKHITEIVEITRGGGVHVIRNGQTIHVFAPNVIRIENEDGKMERWY